MQSVKYQGTYQSGYYYGVPSTTASSGPIFLSQQQYMNYPVLNSQHGFYQESPNWFPYANAYNNGYPQYSPTFYQQQPQPFPRAPALHASPIYSPYSAAQVVPGYSGAGTGTNGLFSPGYDPNNYTYFTYPQPSQYYYQSGVGYAESYEETDTAEYYGSTFSEDYSQPPQATKDQRSSSSSSKESNEPVGVVKGMDLNTGNGQSVETEVTKSEPLDAETTRSEAVVEQAKSEVAKSGKNTAEDSDDVVSEADELAAKLQKLLKMEPSDNECAKTKITLRRETSTQSTQVAGVNHHGKDRERNDGSPAPKVGTKSVDIYCKFCKSNRETPQIYMSHVLKDENGQVVCPILMKHVCPICDKTGTEAHTVKYCPERPQRPEDISRRYRRVRNSVGRLCVLKY